MSTTSISEPSAPTSSTFWDRRATKYAAKPVPDEDAYQRTLRRVSAHLTPNDRVLEIGCGTGTTALKLAPSAREILSTDYSESMITIAKAKAQAAGVNNVRFQTCTLDEPSLAAEPFDAVLAMNLFHLLPDIPARLRRVRELIRPGGLFISKTPCVGDQGLVMRAAIPILQLVGIAPFINFVTERSLLDDVKSAGFEVLETGMYPQKTHSFFIVARRQAPAEAAQ
jgi:ubiquinone/menaquinone biosynthesis C-methylase UbiE